MATLNCYLDVPGFLASQPALPLAGLLGGNSTLSQACAAGATSLTVVSAGGAAGTPGFQPGTACYLLDGPWSEVVQITAVNTTAGVLTLGANLTAGGGTTGAFYAHATGVSVSSGGTLGALGDTLLAASSWAEEYCQQGSPQDRGLFATVRTEKLIMPSTRAYIDRGYGLVLRPHWYPVTALSAVAIEYAPGAASTTFTPTMAEFDTSGMLIKVPRLAPVTGGYPSLGGFAIYNRGADAWASITYTAGFAPDAVPWRFRRAVSFAARELLAYAQNPTGAALVRQGDVQIMARLRGSGGKESSADTVFLTQAKAFLEPYRAFFA
ncbi:MAG: hypothetical protein IVW57_00220 [Ktedonobacterales bacterium]|nr:hypothetical protein [Ktedonobacterales bacterium]